MVVLAEPSSAMAFEMPPPSMRVFQRAVICLAKLGRDVALILRAEEMVVHGADDLQTVAVQFALRRRFFRATPSLTYGTGDEVRETILVVSSRSLLAALKGAQRAEGLTLGLVGGTHGELRLALEFAARYGTKVRHRLPLIESEVMLPGEPSSGPHVAALAPSLIARVLDHCSPSTRGGSCEEVTIAAVPGEGLRVKSSDLLANTGTASTPGTTQANRTEVLLQRSDLEACNLDPRGGEVTFSGQGLRDFAKAIDTSARDLEALGLVDGSPLLELKFGSERGTVVCRMTVVKCGEIVPPADFSGVLLVATRELAGENGTSSTPSLPQTAPGAQQTAAHGAGRRPLPRQGSKRRAVAAPPEAFDAFPEHGTQPEVSAPPQGLPQQASVSRQLQLKPQFRPQLPSQPVWQQPCHQQATQGGTPVPVPGLLLASREWGPPATNLQPQPGLLQPQQQPQVVSTSKVELAHTPTQVAQQPLTQRLGQPAGLQRGPSTAVAWPGAAGTSPHEAQFPATLPAPTLPSAPVLDSVTAAAAAQLLDDEPLWKAALGGRAEPPLQTPFAETVVQNSPLVHQTTAQWHVQPQPPPQFWRSGPTPVLASQLATKALDVPDSDDELIGADPDELAFAQGDNGDDSVDWLDVGKLW